MAYLGNLSLPFDPTRTAAAPRDADRFSGNGSTVAFTLSRAVQKAVDIEVFVENVQQEPITAFDVNQTTLTFTGAPPSGTNNIYVVYRNFDSGAQVYVPDGSITYSKLANNIRIFTTDNLTPNGNNAVFTLSEPPADANTVMVTIDGVVQRAPVHYTTSGSTITFTSNPPAGSNVHVRHLGFRTSTTVTALPAGIAISQPNIASPIVTGSANFDSGTLYVDAANDRVGVGTTTPKDKLHVTGNTQFSVNSIIGSSVTGNPIEIGVSGGSQIKFINSGSFGDEIGLYTHTSGVSHAERVRVDTYGNIGVNNTNPDQYAGSGGTVVNITGQTNYNSTPATLMMNGNSNILGRSYYLSECFAVNVGGSTEITRITGTGNNGFRLLVKITLTGHSAGTANGYLHQMYYWDGSTGAPVNVFSYGGGPAFSFDYSTSNVLILKVASQNPAAGNFQGAMLVEWFVPQDFSSSTWTVS